MLSFKICSDKAEEKNIFKKLEEKEKEADSKNFFNRIEMDFPWALNTEEGNELETL